MSGRPHAYGGRWCSAEASSRIVLWMRSGLGEVCAGREVGCRGPGECGCVHRWAECKQMLVSAAGWDVSPEETGSGPL